jgi:peptidoglycan/LPS O-acetylase OafA/YrhL
VSGKPVEPPSQRADFAVDSLQGVAAARSQQGHFDALDSLRGIAALGVVLYHMPGWFRPFYWLEWVRNSGHMVNFFFVLSGFVLFYSYFGRIENGIGLAKFLTLRFGRIYPVHFVFLMLFLGAEYMKYIAGERGVAAAAKTAFHDNSPSAFVECLFLVQSLGFTPHYAAFNYPSWSISTEFYTYIIFAVATLLLPRRGFTALSIALFSTSLLLHLFARATVGEFDRWLTCICGFFLGCTSCAAYRALSRRAISSAWPAAALLLLAAFLNVPQKGSVADLILPISAFVVVTIALVPKSGASKFLMLRPFRWLGEVSYSLYMCHAIVFFVARQFCRTALKAPEAVVDGATTAQLPSPIAIVLSVASVTAALILAWLSFRFIERPARAQTRAFVESWGKRAVGTARLNADS